MIRASVNSNRTPWLVLVVVGTLLALMAAAAGDASAASGGFGELGRFGERQAQGKTEKTPTPEGRIAGAIVNKENELEEVRYAMGVDPEEGNDVFVLDEPVRSSEKKLKGELDSIEHHVRIQKFDPADGTLLASVNFAVTSPPVEEEEDNEEESFSNIAVDPTRKVLYVLAVEPRNSALATDEEAPVATALYAFKTESSDGKLVPAEHADKGGVEGLLAGSGELQAESEAHGEALIDPRGITVDPSTGEVIILAHIDESGAAEDKITGPGDRYVLQRVTDEGEPGERYVDTTDYFKADARSAEEGSYPGSPAVSDGHVLVHFEGIAEIPANFKQATEKKEPPKQVFLETLPNVVRRVVEAGTQSEYGGSLAASPSAEARLYEPAQVVNEALRRGSTSNPHIAGIAARSDTSGALIGWSGGQSVEVASATDECVLEPGVAETPLGVAAGAGEDVFVLAPEYLGPKESGEPVRHDAIIELGPAGKGCPTASGSTISLEENGGPISPSEPVSTDKELQFSMDVTQADALSAELAIENEGTHAPPIVVTQPLGFVQEAGLPTFQKPQLDFTFNEPGEYSVTEKVHTDDLGTPELTSTAPLVVKVDQAVAITSSGQPAAQSVSEGSSAMFTATASGAPEPTAQWEVLTVGAPEYVSATGVKVSTRAVGKTVVSELTVEKTTMSESGEKFRVIFKNGFSAHSFKAVSNGALLTVTPAVGGKAPAVERQPESKAIVAGESAAFTATASGSPQPTVQWELSSDGGAEWTKIQDAEADTLAVAATTVAESGYQYRARFTNDLNSVTSNAATLTVSSPPAGGGSPGGGAPGGGSPGGGGPGNGVLPSIQAANPKATVAGTSVTVTAGGALVLKITCPADETRCIGVVTLRTLTAVSAAAGAEGREAKAKHAILTLANGSFSVAGGSVQTVKLHLSSEGRGLLGHAHTLRVKAILAAHDPSGAKLTQEQLVTLRLAKG